MFTEWVIDSNGKPDATEAEVVAAGNSSQCKDIIGNFSEGLNIIVGNKGICLTGGEVQRIAPAYAILKKRTYCVCWMKQLLLQTQKMNTTFRRQSKNH